MTTKALIVIILFVAIGFGVQVCAHACDSQELKGWHPVEPRLAFYLDANGKRMKKDGIREFRKFECDGRWRYRIVGQRRTL